VLLVGEILNAAAECLQFCDYSRFSTLVALRTAVQPHSRKPSPLTCSQVRWPRNLSLEGQRHTSDGLFLHQCRCHLLFQHHIHAELEYLQERKKHLCGKTWSKSDLCLSLGTDKQKLRKQQYNHITPAIILIVGALFFWTTSFSHSALLWHDASVGTKWQTSSLRGSAQVKVLRSACVVSTLLSWPLKGATWAASAISSAVSLALKKEWMF